MKAATAFVSFLAVLAFVVLGSDWKELAPTPNVKDESLLPVSAQPPAWIDSFFPPPQTGDLLLAQVKTSIEGAKLVANETPRPPSVDAQITLYQHVPRFLYEAKRLAAVPLERDALYVLAGVRDDIAYATVDAREISKWNCTAWFPSSYLISEGTRLLERVADQGGVEPFMLATAKLDLARLIVAEQTTSRDEIREPDRGCGKSMERRGFVWRVHMQAVSLSGKHNATRPFDASWAELTPDWNAPSELPRGYQRDFDADARAAKFCGAREWRDCILLSLVTKRWWHGFGQAWSWAGMNLNASAASILAQMSVDEYETRSARFARSMLEMEGENGDSKQLILAELQMAPVEAKLVGACFHEFNQRDCKEALSEP